MIQAIEEDSRFFVSLFYSLLKTFFGQEMFPYVHSEIPSSTSLYYIKLIWELLKHFGSVCAVDIIEII